MSIAQIIQFFRNKPKIEKIFNVLQGEKEGLVWITSKRIRWSLNRKTFMVFHMAANGGFKEKVLQQPNRHSVLFSMSAAMLTFEQFAKVKKNTCPELDSFGDYKVAYFESEKFACFLQVARHFHSKDIPYAEVKAKEIPNGTILFHGGIQDFFREWKGCEAVVPCEGGLMLNI